MTDSGGAGDYQGPEPYLGVVWSGEATVPGAVDWHMPAVDLTRDRLGRFSAGSLAVIVDAESGGLNHQNRPPATWTVTSELRIDVLRPPSSIASGLRTRTEFLGDEGHALFTRGDIVDDEGVVASAQVRSMEFPGPEDPFEFVLPEPWPPATLPGSIEEVLATDVRRLSDTTAEVVLAHEQRLANVLGAIHGGRRSGVAEVRARDVTGRVCNSAVVTVYGERD